MTGLAIIHGPIASIRTRLTDIKVPGKPVRQFARRAATIVGVHESALVGPDRDAHLCWIRFGVMLVARRRHSLAAISHTFGRQHTTIVHGIRRAHSILGADPKFILLVDTYRRRQIDREHVCGCT